MGQMQSNISDTDAASILLEFDGKTTEKVKENPNYDNGDPSLVMEHGFDSNDLASKMVAQSMPVIIVDGDLPVTDIIETLGGNIEHRSTLMQDPTTTG